MQMAQTSVIIKNNRVYEHKLARFYYTTYDVRRAEDVINPRTSHSNIMLLSDIAANNNHSDSSDNMHPFLYGRVIGIYHVNVVYTGPGMKGYEAMHFDFLHVRWFQLNVIQASGRQARHHTKGWASLRLDSLSFPPMADEGSFSFVDPTLVLRGCHLIPAFSSGKRYTDGKGLSKVAGDKNDWKHYYVNRSVDSLIIFLHSSTEIISGLQTATWQCDIIGGWVLGIHILMDKVVNPNNTQHQFQSLTKNLSFQIWKKLMNQILNLNQWGWISNLMKMQSVVVQKMTQTQTQIVVHRQAVITTAAILSLSPTVQTRT